MALVEQINLTARRFPTWPLYVVAPLPGLWWFYLGLTGGLGVEPVERLEHLYGELALQILLASLCITPLRTYLRINLIRFRRAVGLIAFFYVVAHLSVWAFLDVQSLSAVWKDIAKRPYITIGMAAFVLLLPLAATSSDWAIRKLGPIRWRRVHKLVYAVILLACLHFVMLAKGWQLEPLLYFGAAVLLLALRVPAIQRRLR